LGPIPNPQSPIPNPQSPFNYDILVNLFFINKYKLVRYIVIKNKEKKKDKY